MHTHHDKDCATIKRLPDEDGNRQRIQLTETGYDKDDEKIELEGKTWENEQVR